MWYLRFTSYFWASFIHSTTVAFCLLMHILKSTAALWSCLCEPLSWCTVCFTDKARERRWNNVFIHIARRSLMLIAVPHIRDLDSVRTPPQWQSSYCNLSGLSRPLLTPCPSAPLPSSRPNYIICSRPAALQTVKPRLWQIFFNISHRSWVSTF